MSDDDLYQLIAKLHEAASERLTRFGHENQTAYLQAQLANEAALAISELVATRTLLLSGPDAWGRPAVVPRRH